MGSKYPILKPNEIIAALTKKNFKFISQKGSHLKYSNGKNVVIIPNHNEIARGTLKSILIQAGIEYDEFMDLL